jgi:hypothetical protein
VVGYLGQVHGPEGKGGNEKGSVTAGGCPSMNDTRGILVIEPVQRTGKIDRKAIFRQVKRAVTRTTGLTKTDIGFQSAVLLMLGLTEVGQDIRELQRATGYRYHTIRARVERLQRYHVWDDGKTICQWDAYGDDAFWLDIMVAEGDLIRCMIGKDDRTEIIYVKTPRIEGPGGRTYDLG